MRQIIKAMNNMAAIPARKPFLKVSHSSFDFLASKSGTPMLLLVLLELSIGGVEDDVPPSPDLFVDTFVVLFVVFVVVVVVGFVVGGFVVGIPVSLHVTLRSLHCQPS